MKVRLEEIHDRCETCPYKFVITTNVYTCRHPRSGWQPIGDIKTIPDFCPLPRIIDETGSIDNNAKD